MRTATVLVLASLAGVPAAPLRADGLPEPTGEVVLTMTGPLEKTNGDGVARFDMAMLRALPVIEFATSTVWTEGVHTFTGVALRDLLDAVGATGDRIRAVALNDYAVEIPVSDDSEGGPILAYTIDGELMSVREQGPLWIVYPFDSNPAYRTETTYARSIWQLDRIAVEE
jgi:hypothetical protein